MEEERLILLVQGYKELYDVQDPRYDDLQRRDNIWKEIGYLMKKPAQYCRGKWRRIRDNYRRAKKLRETKSGLAAKNIKKAKHDDLLSFLNKYVNSEDDTFTNMPSMNVSQDLRNEESSPDENLGRYNLGSSTAGTSQDSSENRPYKRKSTTMENPSHQPPCTHALFPDHLQNKYNAPKSKSDKIIDFFKYLGETVSTFPGHVQISVKRDIFKIVSDAEERVYMEKTGQQFEVQFTKASSIVLTPTPMTIKYEKREEDDFC